MTAGEILDSLTETFKRLIAPCCSEPGTSNANRLAPFIVLDRQNFTIQLVKYANPKSPTSGTHNSAVEKVNADIYNRPASDLPPKTRIVDVISDSFVIYDSDELEITYSYVASLFSLSVMHSTKSVLFSVGIYTNRRLMMTKTMVHSLSFVKTMSCMCRRFCFALG